MNFKNQLEADLGTVFYNTNEFCETANYQGLDIAVNPVDDIEIEHTSSKSYTCLTSDVPLLKEGDLLSISGVTFEVVNFDYLESDLETIMMLKEQ